MEKITIPPFYVGQEVVALKDGIKYPQLKKGNTYIVKGLIRMSCGCCAIDIGVDEIDHVAFCETHNSKRIHVGTSKHFCTSYFAPITSQFQHIEYSKVLEQEQELISVN